MPEDIVLRQPNDDAAVAANRQLSAAVTALVVDSVESHKEGLELLKTVVKVQRGIKDLCQEFRDKAHKAHKAAVAFEKKLMGSSIEDKRTLTRKLDAWEKEQHEIARKAEEEARKAAAKAEEEQRLQDAINAEEAGDTAEAEAILEEAPAPPVIHVPPRMAAVGGVSMRTLYSAEVVDLLALVRFVAENPQYINYLQHNGVALNQAAQSQREAMQIPGVKVVKTTSRAVRRG